MKNILAILIVLFSASTYLSQSQITQEEYNFYEDILNDGKEYVVSRETQSFEEITIKSVKKKFHGLSRELLKDFANANTNSHRLEKDKNFIFNDDPAPINNSNNRIIFKFYLTVTVSRVAFSKDGKQSLAFFSYGSECCFGAYSAIYWMIKSDGKWIEKKRYSPWIH